MIAALYVQTGGVYFGLEGVDPWDERRDARRYSGPWPVVAHPPCARWCRLAKLVETRGGKAVGDDEGTFAAALASVRQWGGVLEHPAGSKAWGAHGLLAPPAFGWARSLDGEWVCEVSQAAYGHRAPKVTWLLYVGTAPPPPLIWSRSVPVDGPWVMCSEGCGEWWCTVHRKHAFECACPPIEEWSASPYSSSRTAGGRRRGDVETMSHGERARTPLPFRDLLIDLAERSRK